MSRLQFTRPSGCFSSVFSWKLSVQSKIAATITMPRHYRSITTSPLLLKMSCYCGKLTASEWHIADLAGRGCGGSTWTHPSLASATVSYHVLASNWSTWRTRAAEGLHNSVVNDFFRWHKNAAIAELSVWCDFQLLFLTFISPVAISQEKTFRGKEQPPLK